MPLVKTRKAVPKKAAPPVSAEVSRRIAKVRTKVSGLRAAESEQSAMNRIIQDEIALEQARSSGQKRTVREDLLNKAVNLSETPVERSNRLRGTVRAPTSQEALLEAIQSLPVSKTVRLPQRKKKFNVPIRDASTVSWQTARGPDSDEEPPSPPRPPRVRKRDVAMSLASGTARALGRVARGTASALGNAARGIGQAGWQAAATLGPPALQGIATYGPPALEGVAHGVAMVGAPILSTAGRAAAATPAAVEAIANGVVHAAREAAPGVAAGARGTADLVARSVSAAGSLGLAVANGSAQLASDIGPPLAQGIASGAAALAGASASAASSIGRQASALVEHARSRPVQDLPDSDTEELRPTMPDIDEERNDWEQRGRAAGLSNAEMNEKPLPALMRVVENAEDRTPAPMPQGRFPQRESYAPDGRRLIDAGLAERAAQYGVPIPSGAKYYDAILRKIEAAQARRQQQEALPSPVQQQSTRSRSQGIMRGFGKRRGRK